MIDPEDIPMSTINDAMLALVEITNLHSRVAADDRHDMCDECSQDWPCRTVTILDHYQMPIGYDPSEPS